MISFLSIALAFDVRQRRRPFEPPPLQRNVEESDDMTYCLGLEPPAEQRDRAAGLRAPAPRRITLGHAAGLTGSAGRPA
jgi:hypothetical protein